MPGVAVGDPVLVTLCSVLPSLCVPSVSAGHMSCILLPPRFRALSHSNMLRLVLPVNGGSESNDHLKDCIWG
jgi:hypothetical protein